MPSKYRKRIPPEIKEKALMDVWTGKKTVKETCRELGITKQAFWKWQKKAKAAMAKSLMEEEGRKTAGEIPDGELRKAIGTLREENKELEKQVRKTEKQKLLAEDELWITRKIIEIKIETGELDLSDKKNAKLVPVIRRLFSITPEERPSGASRLRGSAGR